MWPFHIAIIDTIDFEGGGKGMGSCLLAQPLFLMCKVDVKLMCLSLDTVSSIHI